MALKIEYEGVDITDTIGVDSVNQPHRCWIDQYSEGHADTIKVVFADSEGQWDTWHPQSGEKIRIYNDNVDSGIQYVRGVYPAVGKYEIDAASTPITMESERRDSWNEITKLSLANDIASRHKLALKTYGVTDCKFKSLKQDMENDLSFFESLCVLEGDSFLVYNGKLILYSDSYMENQSPSKTIDLSADSKMEYQDEQKITALTVTDGSTSYTYGGDTSRLEIVKIPIHIDSTGTAERWAKNLHHHINKMDKSGPFYINPLADGYTAGSIAILKTNRIPSFDGKIFIHHARHDMINNKTKVFFRCI